MDKRYDVIVLADDFDSHADLIILNLQDIGYRPIRINTEQIHERVSDINIQISTSGAYFSLTYCGHTLKSQDIIAVYNRNYNFSFLDNTEFMDAFDELTLRELKASFEGCMKILTAKWINNPWVVNKIDDKLFQLHTANSIGFNIPKSLVSNNTKLLKYFYEANNETVIKQLSPYCFIDNTNKNSAVFTSKLEEKHIQLLEKMDPGVCFLNEYINKEYDLRVTVIGRKKYPVKIFSQKAEKTKIDFRVDYNLDMELCILPNELSTKIDQYMDSIGIVFGAFDFVVDKSGKYYFLEVNPEGNWLWMEKKLGLDICNSVANELVS